MTAGRPAASRRSDRRGDATLLRGDRFFRHGNDWFFRTREGTPVGPYDSRTGAVEGAIDYIQFVETAPRGVVRVLFGRDRDSQ